jgi:cell wall-associated NlpC family hydrolase
MVRSGKDSLNLVGRLTWIVILGLLAACASAPDSSSRAGHDYAPRADQDTAIEAAELAKKMVGKPYRYGGHSPSGFDCSGLVYYSFERVGVSVPRTTRSQLKAGVPVASKSLRVGDLVFFDQEGKKFSHVGIYIGNGRFVHAPSSGKHVRIDSLNQRYWRKHFVAARRI